MINRRITAVLTATAFAGAGMLATLSARAQGADASQLAITISKVDLQSFDFRQQRSP